LKSPQEPHFEKLVDALRPDRAALKIRVFFVTVSQSR